MNAPIHSNEWEMLSAYLDGQLSESEQRRVQDLLARRDDLRAGLEELRRTRAVLRAAPRRRVPRNFTLTPAMVQKAPPRFLWNWAPALGVASALATVLLVLTFFLQFQPAVLSTASQPAASPRVAQEDGAAQRQAGPPIIVWNSAPSGMGGGMGGSEPVRGTDFGQPTTEALTAPLPSAGQTAATPAANNVPGPAATPAPAMPALAPTAPAAATPPADTAPKSGSGIPPTAPTPSVAGTPVGAGIPSSSPTGDQVMKSAPATAPGAQSTDPTGPILGVAPTEDRGKMVVPTLPSMDTYGVRATEAPQNAGVRTAQFLLAAVAMLTGAAALFLWWRARH